MASDSENSSDTSQSLDADSILESALALAAERDNWYDLSLIELADYCGTSVNQIRFHYADTNAIANAWFARALEAMLAADPETVEALSVKERLAHIIWCWFEALGPHHRISAQMLGAKLHLPHIHHWLPMAFDLSRLVQFWREAAGLHASGRRRQIEEVILTSIFLATLRRWCRDDSPQQHQTHARLITLLSRAERAAAFCYPTQSH